MAGTSSRAGKVSGLQPANPWVRRLTKPPFANGIDCEPTVSGPAATVGRGRMRRRDGSDTPIRLGAADRHAAVRTQGCRQPATD